MSVEEALALVEQILEPERLTKVQKLVFRYSWEGKSYDEIAKVEDYGVGYLKDAGSWLWQSLSKKSGERVSKLNLQLVVARLTRQAATQTNQTIAQPSAHCDWAEAIDTSNFYGRQTELTTLNQWIVEDRCRLISILGMGGMGKTALAIKLAEQVQSQFEFVIWRSLRNAPPFTVLIAELILFLSNQKEVELPKAVDAQIDRLMQYLRSTRCLLVLDNVESILRSGERAGRYRPGYEGYDQLIRQMADGRHQSCLILTSREKPDGLSTREGMSLPVRSLQLSGIRHDEAQCILELKGLATPSGDCQQLVDRYAGNPLALKIAATTIQSVFGSKVANFLEQSAIVFGDLWDLLDQQFQRLSSLEQQVMYWLAINREPMTIAQLREDIVPLVSHRELIEAVESLQARSLIEQADLAEAASTSFTQQSAVMEYMTERLISQFHREIATQDLELFKTHMLIKAQTKDYIRDSQINTILAPLTHQLEQSFQPIELIKQQLNQLLLQVRAQDIGLIEYEVVNLINLLNHLRGCLGSSSGHP